MTRRSLLINSNVIFELVQVNDSGIFFSLSLSSSQVRVDLHVGGCHNLARSTTPLALSVGSRFSLIISQAFSQIGSKRVWNGFDEVKNPLLSARWIYGNTRIKIAIPLLSRTSIYTYMRVHRGARVYAPTVRAYRNLIEEKYVCKKYI